MEAISQQPGRAGRDADAVDRLLDRNQVLDRRARVAQQPAEVDGLRVHHCRPIVADRAMARHDGGDVEPPQVGHHRDPATQAAVDRRQVLHEQQVGREQRLCALVVDGQVVVGVSSRPGLQRQHTIAQVEVQCLVHADTGVDDGRGVELDAEVAPQCVQVERLARFQRAGESSAGHKLRRALCG